MIFTLVRKILYYLLSAKWEGEQRTHKLLLFTKRWSSIGWWWLHCIFTHGRCIHTWCTIPLLKEKMRKNGKCLNNSRRLVWYTKNTHIYLVPLTRDSQKLLYYTTIITTAVCPYFLHRNGMERRAMGWWRHNKHTLTLSQ